MEILTICGAALVAAGSVDVHAPSAHAQSGPQAAKPQTTASGEKSEPKTAKRRVQYGTDRLPAPVVDMREAIQAAIRAGDITALRPAIQMNELKPDFGAGDSDPISHLQRLSADGTGRDILAILANLLDAGFATVPLGRDAENNGLFVWPYHAEVPLDALSPGQYVEFLRIVPHSEARAMVAAKRYSGWRLVIGADGVWHAFVRQKE
jgi:hypothetical protein